LTINSPPAAYPAGPGIFVVERVTRIELALSAWESVLSRDLTCPELPSWLSARDREMPGSTGVNGTLMARAVLPPRSGADHVAKLSAAVIGWGLHPIGAGVVEPRVEVKLRLLDALDWQRSPCERGVLVWRGRAKGSCG
jgi:hypothetical protein